MAKINPKTQGYKKALDTMQKKLAKSFSKLKLSITKHASVDKIKKESHELLLLLGEVNYLAKECKKMEKTGK